MNDIECVDHSLGQISEEEKNKVLNYYSYDSENNVFIAQACKKPIDYADGSEEYLKKIFEEISESGGEQNTGLQKYIVDWPSRYHLSGMRVNLLEAVAELFKPAWNALELGGGMGAVTPWLAKRFQTVDVIEGSLLRANVLRQRVANINTVRVFVDDMLQSEWPRPAYEFISLLGVLEYLPYFSDTASPELVCVNFLQKVNKALTDDGILAIAIENKLGAKYFSGCSEDHNGRLFSGLIGYPEKSPITFSRYELFEILRKSGFGQCQLYHLFPDYKLPKVVIREDPSMYDFNVGGIVRGLFEDYTERREYLMPDPLLLSTLSKSRLLHEMSNSFLVLCSKSKVTKLKTQAVITKFWNNDITKPVYHHKTKFYNTPVKRVKRVSLEAGQSKVSEEGLQFRLAAEEPFIEGNSLILEAYRAIMRRDGYSSLHELLKVLRQHLIAAYGTGRNDEEGYQLISGQAVDYCFNNLIRTEAHIAFIDRKWALESEISEDYVMFRSLFELFKEMSPFIQESKASEFVVKLMNGIFPQYNDSRFSSNLNFESKFQSLVNIMPVICADIDIDAGKKALELQKR